MEVIGLVCMLVAVVIALVYGIQLLILAFQQSVFWGLAYLLIPFASLVFIIMHWDETRSPFLKSLLAIPFYVLGMALLPR